MKLLKTYKVAFIKDLKISKDLRTFFEDVTLDGREWMPTKHVKGEIRFFADCMKDKSYTAKEIKAYQKMQNEVIELVKVLEENKIEIIVAN